MMLFNRSCTTSYWWSVTTTSLSYTISKTLSHYHFDSVHDCPLQLIYFPRYGSSKDFKQQSDAQGHLKSLVMACMVVQAVVKANTRSYGKWQISTPWGSETSEF